MILTALCVSDCQTLDNKTLHFAIFAQFFMYTTCHTHAQRFVFTVVGSSAQASGQRNLETETEAKPTTNGTTWRCPRACHSFAV